jgi:hypothetical protein
VKTGFFEKLIDIVCNNFVQLIRIVVGIELWIKIIFIKNLDDVLPNGLHAPMSCSPFLEDLKMG